jgi:glycerol uptake facilitator-like aquaporin
MRLTPWYLAAVAPIAVAGFLGAFLGQCAVLAVTIGIFVGTLSLGRHAPQPAPPETANTTELT